MLSVRNVQLGGSQRRAGVGATSAYGAKGRAIRALCVRDDLVCYRLSVAHSDRLNAVRKTLLEDGDSMSLGIKIHASPEVCELTREYVKDNGSAVQRLYFPRTNVEYINLLNHIGDLRRPRAHD